MIDLETISELIEIVKSINYKIYLKLKTVNNAITLSDLLKIFEFDELPKIVTYTDKNIKIKQEDGEYNLILHGKRWMSFTPDNLEQMFELYSHYNLAEGHCICTGLGFALREKWLLSNNNVTKITVLEKSKEIIDYHKKINPSLIDKIEIVNCNASEFIGECDTLLLDHYEYDTRSNSDVYSAFETIQICTENIKHNKLWFWPLESIVREGDFENEYSAYQFLRKSYPTLPNITESQLISYCKMFYFLPKSV